MGQLHKIDSMLNPGGEKLHEMERQSFAHDMNEHLISQEVPEWARAAALAHFDIGYDEGHSGDDNFFNEEWDRPMGAEGA